MRVACTLRMMTKRSSADFEAKVECTPQRKSWLLVSISANDCPHWKWPNSCWVGCSTPLTNSNILHFCTSSLEIGWQNMQQQYIDSNTEIYLTFFCNLITDVHFFSNSPLYLFSTSFNYNITITIRYSTLHMIFTTSCQAHVRADLQCQITADTNIWSFQR